MIDMIFVGIVVLLLLSMIDMIFVGIVVLLLLSWMAPPR